MAALALALALVRVDMRFTRTTAVTTPAPATVPPMPVGHLLWSRRLLPVPAPPSVDGGQAARG
jgi:hypothetical protein